MTYTARRFGLSNEPGRGVWCGEDGVLVGDVPLLKRVSAGSEPSQWQPCAISDLNRDLSKLYDVPIELVGKSTGLKAIARALNRGDLLHAQIATLHLQIPDPPQLTKSPPIGNQLIDLARQLQISGLLKEDWDPTKHPRWPARSPGSIGGRFAPAGASSDESAVRGQGAPTVLAQIPIPFPLELPTTIPLPSEILPPLAIPNINPRSNLRNPYPDREGCDEEWAHALEHCQGLIDSKKMGRDGSRGFGDTFQQCVLGMVSERCGGSLRS